MTLRTDYTPEELQQDNHPEAHNSLAGVVNALVLRFKGALGLPTEGKKKDRFLVITGYRDSENPEYQEAGVRWEDLREIPDPSGAARKDTVQYYTTWTQAKWRTQRELQREERYSWDTTDGKITPWCFWNLNGNDPGADDGGGTGTFFFTWSS